MENIFAYGTLNESTVQRMVWGRLISGKPDVLVNHGLSRIKIDGREYLVAVPKDEEMLAGQVLEVTADELALIDRYETVAYRRKLVSLKSGVKAWVYLSNE